MELSPEHHSISSGTCNSEAENRDFLIDDEISDQPELVLNSNIDKKDLMKSIKFRIRGTYTETGVESIAAHSFFAETSPDRCPPLHPRLQ